MKTISKYIFGGVLLSALALTGCKDKMRELNTNQTSLQSTDPRYMFFAATRLFDNSDGRGFCATRSMSIGRWMQYFANTGSSYPAATDLSISSPWPGAYWSEFNVRNGSQLHALCECLPWHFSMLNQGEELGRMPMEGGRGEGREREREKIDFEVTCYHHYCQDCQYLLHLFAFGDRLSHQVSVILD